MKQGLSLRVSQHLALTPQLQQSIRVLQLSTVPVYLVPALQRRRSDDV